MYFKKLELAGFKSFGEKTVLHFEPGITAVVGPNGCGKSNIFDSIRWCLGEQSIKSLRGSKMEDVIFNGTETTPAQNMAEVSLTISNEAKILPIDYEEVTITRRLFRTGESEYLINNNLMRLKDINELLMGTGIGAESYSLVEQGKIDLVISSRPEDRRLVFDEATGVSKYKAKKREANNKLEDTDNNLLRVNDIIVEVKRQIGSIERQASKARRYKEIFEQLKTAELKFSTYELKKTSSELTMLAEMIKNSHEEENLLNKQLEELDAKLISHQKELQELDSSLTALREDIRQQENTKEQKHQHIRLNLERINDLKKHADSLNAQKEQLTQKISSHENNVSELTDQFLSLHQVYAQKEAVYKKRETAFETLNQTIDTLLTENKKNRENIFNVSLKETQINNELGETTTSLHTLLARQKRLETEKIKTNQEHEEFVRQLQALAADVNHKKETLRAITASLDSLRKEKVQREQTLKSREEFLRGLENEKLSLNSQAQFLKELKLKYDQMPEASRGILEIPAIPKENISGIIAHAKSVQFDENTRTYRVECELKFISFDLGLLESRIQELGRQIEETILGMSEQEKDLMELLGRMQTTEDHFQEQKGQLLNMEAVLSNLTSNDRKLTDELSLMGIELDEVLADLHKSKDAQMRLKNELSACKAENANLEARISENIQNINSHTSTKEKMLVELTELKTELTNQKGTEEALEAKLNFFKKALEDDQATLYQNDQDVQESCQKIEQLSAENTSLEEQINASTEIAQSKTKELDHLSATRTESLNGLDFVQKQIIDVEEKSDSLKEDVHRTQMQEQELNFKRINIKNRIVQAYSIDLDQTPVPEADIQGLAVEDLNQQITTLKDKVESFGTVNLVAIEELEELKNRFDFLTQQQNDLLQAKDSLQKAIQKINRTTRKMFLETFALVADEFKNHFKLLFGGGDARLFLIDEEDVLESGIEIICRPPGKKLQNISLLSGGEKALSAIALIFAIFKTKPSPFCVLDEIDAALDESNIGRFSRMLGDFAKTSQFIVITHNKKTITMSHMMYGITMEQSGISKIVSVKLQENNISSRTKSVQPSTDKELTSEPA
ncbi:MAG: AAA family ATPase [Candidatus Omnitrophota bacterium]